MPKSRSSKTHHSTAHNYAAGLLDGLMHEAMEVREMYWTMWERMPPPVQEKWDRLALAKVLRELTVEEANWVSDQVDIYSKEGD